MKYLRYSNIVFLLAFMAVATLALAEAKLKPFIMVNQPAAGDFATVVNKTRDALKAGGFDVAGEYSPYKGATVIIVTNDAMRKHAAQSDKGGFGAMQRVSVTQVGDKVQVAYTNPVYMANAYRMKTDMSAFAARMSKVLGAGAPFGSEDGLTAKALRKYHYKIFMPYFDDPWEIKEYDSQEKALAAVEAGLAKKAGGVSKVYRIDIPGKKEVVFGVALTRKCSGDEFIMGKIDFGKQKHTPHLPYEIVVSKGTVYALSAKFRIAINFPDLSMIGSNSFFSIMCAPGETEEAFENMVKGVTSYDD